MNAIRLSESPTRKNAINEEEAEVVDLISDDDQEEGEEGGGDQDTAVIASSSRPSDLNMIDVDVQDGIEPPPTKSLSTHRAMKHASTSASHKPPSAAVPKKRLDLTSGTLAFPLLPVPTNFTRLGAIPETSTSSSRRKVPYVELVRWTEAQKAEYTHRDTTRGLSGEPDNLSAFLSPDMTEIPPIPMSVPTVYEVIDSDEDIVPIPPPKRRALLIVEIPVRRSQSVQTGSRPYRSRQQNANDDSENKTAVGKKGKSKSAELDSGNEAERLRPLKSSKEKSRAPIDNLESESGEDQPKKTLKEGERERQS